MAKPIRDHRWFRSLVHGPLRAKFQPASGILQVFLKSTRKEFVSPFVHPLAKSSFCSIVFGHFRNDPATASRPFTTASQHPPSNSSADSCNSADTVPRLQNFGVRWRGLRRFKDRMERNTLRVFFFALPIRQHIKHLYVYGNSFAIYIKSFTAVRT